VSDQAPFNFSSDPNNTITIIFDYIEPFNDLLTLDDWQPLIFWQ